MRHIIIYYIVDLYGLDGKILVLLLSIIYNKRIKPPVSIANQEYLNNYIKNIMIDNIIKQNTIFNNIMELNNKYITLLLNRKNN